MSDKRVSNETLGKVIINLVKGFEKNLKTQEQTLTHLREELNRISRFSID